MGNNKWNILWLNSYAEDKEIIEKLRSNGFNVYQTSLGLDDDYILNLNWKDKVDIIVFSSVNTKVDKSIIEKFKNLKLILTRSTYCNHIDIRYCRERDIKACCIRGYSTISTAEYTVTLILSLLRKIKSTILNIEKCIFERDMGTDLYGKVVGVIGTGNIGSNVAKVLTCLGAEVKCWSFRKRKELEDVGIKYISLEELYETSDVITFHLALSDKTYHIFNKDTLKILKHGVYLINTGRGELVDLEAVYEGLKRNIIAGCALDCFEGENFFMRGNKDVDPYKIQIIKEIAKYPNVIITPHNAYNSKEAIIRDIEFTYKSIIHFRETGGCLYPCL
ncbi:MAG: NAD(P)-dependent oxidoreductase [candidate division WOR-3 bacterium]